MFEKLFGLLGYEKKLLVTEQPENITSEPSLEDHISKICRYHNENFLKIEEAISHTQRDLELLIGSSASKESENTLIRLNTLLLGVWCESRLHKLVYEKNLFSEEERKLIYSGSNLEDKWKRSLEIALRRNKGIELEAPLGASSLGYTTFKVYNEINGWIDYYFVPVIKLRNKIAHSQWVNPFTNYQSGWESSWTFKFCPDSKALLSNENILTLKYKHELLKRIATAINNLSLANTAYNVQDFDSTYMKISEQVDKLSSLNKESLKSYREALINGHNRKQLNIEKTIIEKLKSNYDLVPKQ